MGALSGPVEGEVVIEYVGEGVEEDWVVTWARKVMGKWLSRKGVNLRYYKASLILEEEFVKKGDLMTS